MYKDLVRNLSVVIQNPPQKCTSDLIEDKQYIINMFKEVVLSLSTKYSRKICFRYHKNFTIEGDTQHI